jgi:inner membrane protein
MKFPLLAKLTALGAVMLGLVWSLGSVSDVVRERSGRLQDAQRSVADSLANSQTIVGPVLQRACKETWMVDVGEGKTARKVSEQRAFTVHALPHKLTVDGSAAIEPRYRGIFKVNAYSLNLDLGAEWIDLTRLTPKPLHEGGVIACESPTLLFALGDTRGIRSAELRVQGQPVSVHPGTGHATLVRGVHARLADALLQAGASDAAPLRAALHLGLMGTAQLAFTPIAAENQFKLASNWPHPSFGGRFLPSERVVEATGFSAAWQVSALATTARDAFVLGRGVCSSGPASPIEAADVDSPNDKARRGLTCIETFGVDFIDPVNPYVMSERASKYGVLFIVLTFVAVGLVEAMKRLRVHPIQYLLVGSALVVFFLLLVSLSEQWPFGWAYFTAAAASTALLSYYGVHVLRGVAPGLVFGSGIATMFGALYVLLQLEQGSLVLGSVLLFAVLAAVMAVTRKLDWYALLEQLRVDKSMAPRAFSATATGSAA